MAIVRISRRGEEGGEGEGEALTPSRPTTGVTSDFTRVTQNLTLADHVGKFVAGEVSSQFRNESLADMLKGRNMVMVSGSWG